MDKYLIKTTENTPRNKCIQYTRKSLDDQFSIIWIIQEQQSHVKYNDGN